MHRLKYIRKQLGFTQWQLAGFLGIGRTMVNMVEKGKRDLNTPALLKLAQLEKIMYRLQLDQQRVEIKGPVKLPAGIDPEMEKDLQLNTLILNRRIRKIETEYQQAQNLEKVLKLLDDEGTEKTLLSYLRLNVSTKINRCSGEARKILRNKFLSFSNQCHKVRNHLEGAMCNLTL